MDFGLSEEQELLQDTVRSFAKGECPVQRLREIYDAGGHEPALWKGLAELGCAGLGLPESVGGAGLELLECALVAEVLGGAAFPSPFLGHTLAGTAIALGGSEAQRKRWLPALAAGEAMATVAFGERGERWLPADWSVRAEGGRLHGEKRFVPFGARADLVVVGTAGGGLALVEPRASGVQEEPVDALDRSQAVVGLRFDGAAADPLPEGAS